MFDLDDLDFELDEDFPGDPFDAPAPRNFPFDRSPAKSENKIDAGPSARRNDPGKRSDENSSTFSQKDRLLDLISSSSSRRETRSPTVGKRKILEDETFSNRIPVNIVNSNSENNEKTIKELGSGKRLLTNRKFPGPAGLLPDKPVKDLSDVHLVLEGETENVASEKQEDSVILCSQSHSAFSEASYKKLKDDFGMNEPNSSLNKYSICWVKREALKNTFCGKKVPFLAVMLHNVDPSSPDPVLTFRDATGEIYGTLHREVWMELGSQLHPGAAVAMRQVGVLITGMARKQVYLNVTINNILTIYSYSDENIQTNVINKVTNAEIKRAVADWQLESNLKHRNFETQQLFPVRGNGAWSTSVIRGKQTNFVDGFGSGVDERSKCDLSISNVSLPSKLVDGAKDSESESSRRRKLNESSWRPPPARNESSAGLPNRTSSSSSRDLFEKSEDRIVEEFLDEIDFDEFDAF